MPYRAPAEVDSSFCLLCGSEGGPGSQCEVCLVARPSLDVEPTMNRTCGRCGKSLVAVAIAPGTNLHACLSCASLFVPPRAWSR